MMNSRHYLLHHILFCGAALLAVSGAVCAQMPPSATPPAPLYIIDPIETHSRFEVKFLGFMTVRGKFNRTTGTLNHDPERTDAASRANDAILAIIDSTTLNAHVVNSAATNKVLRSAEFFNVEKFPSIEFRSSRFVWEADKLTAIDGTLTLVGATKPVQLIVQKSGCAAATATATAQKRARCTADAYLNVKRSDFGMKAWAASVGDEVKIIVELVAYAALPSDPKSDSKSDSKPEVKVDEATSATPPPTPPTLQPPAAVLR